MTLKDCLPAPPSPATAGPKSQLGELIEGSGPQKGMCRYNAPRRGPPTFPHGAPTLHSLQDGQQDLPRMEIPSYPSAGLAQAETSKGLRAQHGGDTHSTWCRCRALTFVPVLSLTCSDCPSASLLKEYKAHSMPGPTGDPSDPAPAYLSLVLPIAPQPHRLLSVARTMQACSCPRAFAFTLPQAWKSPLPDFLCWAHSPLLSLGTNVTSSERPALIALI